MNQKGFTLIEVLVAMAVGSMILVAAVASAFQVFYDVRDIRVKTNTLTELENAAHWLTRDVVMGLNTNLEDGALPVAQANVTWLDYTMEAEVEESVSHSVSYTYSGTELQRNYDGVVTTVGKHLTDVDFSVNGRFVTVTLTCSIDEEAGAAVTRTYKILMRGEPGL